MVNENKRWTEQWYKRENLNSDGRREKSTGLSGERKIFPRMLTPSVVKERRVRFGFFLNGGSIY